LLQLELRRTEPDKVGALHERAAQWLATHGFGVEAVRHAQAARDWGLAARLLADHWPGLHLGGQAGTTHELLAGFPAEALAADAELAVVAAADELARGSMEAARRYLGHAEQRGASVPEGRRGRALVLLGVVRLLVARQRGNPAAVTEEARRLQTAAEAPEAGQPGLGEELRALALISLGISELWAAPQGEAQRHLEQGVALARRIGRPYLEFSGLAYQAMGELPRSFARVAELSGQAIALARRHGWTDDTAAAVAYVALGSALAWQGRAEEAEVWVERAERAIRPEAEPVAALAVWYLRAILELARGRNAEALAAFQSSERLAGRLIAPYLLVTRTKALRLHTLVRHGETERAEEALAGLDDGDRDRGEMRIAAAALRLAQGNPDAAIEALAPVIDECAPVTRPTWLVHAFMLEAIARDALGDPAAAARAVEHALDLAEPDGALAVFLLYPARDLLERHTRERTAHAALLAQILDLLTGATPVGRSAGGRPQPLLEPLSDSETRVLRYLPTHLSAPEIGAELSVSTSTVKTHMRNLYAKLGVHSRAEAVQRAEP
jgi:LuxR family maltose regulon positive regulatory protein